MIKLTSIVGCLLCYTRRPVNQPNATIGMFETLAPAYDKLAADPAFNWRGPDVLFGMTHEYVQPDNALLDIGIGTGLSSVPFHRAGLSITGIDGSANMLEICRQKNIAQNLVQKDLSDSVLPFEDGSFDVVISNSVLYLFKDLQKIIAEVRRVCKDSGVFSFDIETAEGNAHRTYVEHEGSLVAKDSLEKAGICEYKHDHSAVLRILEMNAFSVLKTLNYHAYTSPSTKSTVHFTAIVAQKTAAQA